MYNFVKSNKYSKNKIYSNYRFCCSFYQKPNQNNNNEYLFLSIAIVYYLMNKKNK